VVKKLRGMNKLHEYNNGYFKNSHSKVYGEKQTQFKQNAYLAYFA
jgi:hypothetical protein